MEQVSVNFLAQKLSPNCLHKFHGDTVSASGILNYSAKSHMPGHAEKWFLDTLPLEDPWYFKSFGKKKKKARFY